MSSSGVSSVAAPDLRSTPFNSSRQRSRSAGGKAAANSMGGIVGEHLPAPSGRGLEVTAPAYLSPARDLPRTPVTGPKIDPGVRSNPERPEVSLGIPDLGQVGLVLVVPALADRPQPALGGIGDL